MNQHEAGYIFELPRGPPHEEEIYPEDMIKYVGVYQTEDPNVNMKVVIHEGRLVLEIQGQPIKLELHPPDDEGKWHMRINPTVAVSFNETEYRRIDSLHFTYPTAQTTQENV